MMTTRERAEKYADQFMFGWTREERITFFEGIIKDEIKMCVEVRDGIGTGLGLMANALLDKAMSRVRDVKDIIEAERQGCLKIADEIRKRELANYNGANYPAHTIAEEIADQIRARGKNPS